MVRNIHFFTLLMWLNKAEIWALADYWLPLSRVRNETLVCYQGIIDNGCQHCTACHLCQRGLQQYLADQNNIMTAMRRDRKPDCLNRLHINSPIY